MADYYSSAIVDPELPSGCMNELDGKFLTACGFEMYEHDGKTYLSAEKYESFVPYTDPDTKEERDITFDDQLEIFQGIINRSQGKVPYIVLEVTNSCSKMRPDGFGAYVYFITAKGCKHMSTYRWAEKMKGQFEKKAKKAA